MAQIKSNAGNVHDRVQSVPLNATPLGYMQLTALSSAKTIVSATGGGAIPAGAAYAVIQAEAQSIRYRDDATAPTAAIGMLLAAGQSIAYSVRDFTKLQMIQVTAGAIVNILFYGE